MLTAAILDRIDENHQVVCKLRATAEPKAHKKVKYQLAAAAAQIGILP